MWHVEWERSNHTVADLRDLSDAGRLELKPDFQRRFVWSKAAQIMLIDSIMHNVPMPKIFFQSIILDGHTHRIVIDGQQRLTAILGFVRNEYALEDPYEGDYHGKTFSQLPDEIQNKILRYEIDANDIHDVTSERINDIYSRVNKYTVQLNKQELRRADYPGQFLLLSETLVNNRFLVDNKVFTVANMRRMGDVEYISELLALLLKGPQDKKEELDNFYKAYAKWPENERARVRDRFESVINDLMLIWKEDDELGELKAFSKTRFHQKADLYALFNAIDDFHQMGFHLEGKDLTWVRNDLALLDKWIEPESDIRLFQKYAIQCVSQSNTVASRTWRCNVLKAFLAGVYKGEKPDVSIVREFHNIIVDAAKKSPLVLECSICKKRFSGPQDVTSDSSTLVWPCDAVGFHLSNAGLIHKTCLNAAKDGGYFADFAYETGECNADIFA